MPDEKFIYTITFIFLFIFQNKTKLKKGKEKRGRGEEELEIRKEMVTEAYVFSGEMLENDDSERRGHPGCLEAALQDNTRSTRRDYHSDLPAGCL